MSYWVNISQWKILNDTNKRLESFNDKLKSVVPTFSNLDDFIEKLFILLTR